MKLKINNKLSFWLDIGLNLIIIVGLVFLIRTFIVSPFQVYGSSMCDSFNFIDNKCQNGYGEYIIVNKFGYQNFFGWQVGLPQRGDVVIFHPPGNNREFFIKRVIGLPEETVKIKDNKIFIFNDEYPQGVQLEEDYLNSKNKDNTRPREAGDVFEVPENSFFVLGDNRLGSSDSRSCFRENVSQGNCGENGNSPYLPMNHIEGKALFVLWPLNKLAIVSNPTYNQ
ncbi:signal peptidase I [Patescibacteria group bacterium]|nr:signal peptidase I [Patescibacteria group bacterium]MBU1703385.1 signal peptidase I [Patescibacteria group bacterium]MBU1953820.1 signal peptidase I [Patescibacteria group bacterium]